jgi:uncharacterized protein
MSRCRPSRWEATSSWSGASRCGASSARASSNPEAFTPGKVEEVDFSMPDVNHTFRKGHRIMVQVQSSWFPVTDRNPQTFTDIPHAKPEQFQKATERVYHSDAAPSGIVIGTLGPD